MSQVIGTYTKLLLCPEKSFKVDPTTFTGLVKSLPFNSNGLSASQNTTDSSTMTGKRDATEAIYGNIDASGDITVPLDFNAFGWWLAFAFGSPTTVENTGMGTYTHTFMPGNTQPSAIIEKVSEAQGVFLRTNGCKVSKMSFSFGGDSELISTISVSGCKEENATAILGGAEVASEVTLNRVNPFQISSLTVDGTAVAIATELKLDIDFGLDTNGYAIGDNGYRSRLNEGIIKPSGSMTAFFDDMTYLEKAKNSTEVAIALEATKGTSSLQVAIPELKFAITSPSIDGQAGITQQLSYNAYYGNNSDGHCVKFVLTNDVASYAFAAE